MQTRHLAIVGLVVVSTPAFSQTTPTIENGTLETQVATRGLGREIAVLGERLTQPAWIGDR